MKPESKLKTIQQEIALTVAKVERQFSNVKQKINATLDSLPIGITINGFTLTSLAGDKFWIDQKGKVYTSYQFWENYAQKIADYLEIDRYNFFIWEE
jgi:hypothetical protein